MFRIPGRWTAAATFALALVVSAPALASAHGSHPADRVGVHNGGTAVVESSGTGAQTTRSVNPLSVHAFPSAASNVIGSVGFINLEEIGSFWSVSRGDSVAETFAGPAKVRLAILQLDIPSNFLATGQVVDWTVSINGTDVGSFVVHAGQVGPFPVTLHFPGITGGSYAVKMRVTNEVPAGGGSHTLRYAGVGAHTITLKKR